MAIPVVSERASSAGLAPAREYAEMANSGEDAARTVIAQYAFKGLHLEMERTLPLRPGEDVIFAGLGRRYITALWQPLTYIRLSSDRLCILEHFKFRQDRIIEIPPRAVTDVAAERLAVAVSVRMEDGSLRRLRISGWRGLRLATPPLRINVRALAEDLLNWRHHRE